MHKLDEFHLKLVKRMIWIYTKQENAYSEKDSDGMSATDGVAVLLQIRGELLVFVGLDRRHTYLDIRISSKGHCKVIWYIEKVIQ